MTPPTKILVADDDPDILLDGWDVLARVRQEPGTRDLPVVLMTARAHDRDQIRGWHLGAK